MADWDWVKTALQALVPLVTGTAGLFLGTWQAGKRSGKQEAELEAKIKAELIKEATAHYETLRVEMRRAIMGVSDDQINHREAFDGLRRQMDENRLHTEQTFVRKDDFREFRDEIRSAHTRIDDKLDRLLGLKKLQ